MVVAIIVAFMLSIAPGLFMLITHASMEEQFPVSIAVPHVLLAGVPLLLRQTQHPGT